MSSTRWPRVGCLLAVAFSLTSVSAADAGPLRLDAEFGDGGIARVPFSVFPGFYPARPVRQPDGKVLVAASNDAFHGNSEILIARFTRKGQPDPTFGHRGRQRIGLRWNFDPKAVHVQRDGRILVLGGAGYGPGLYPTPGQFGLARLLPDGSRDLTFGTNGFVTWTPPWQADTHSLYALPGLFVPRADGRVLAAGVVEETKGPQGRFGPPQTSVRRIAFVRFNRDGSVDQSFGRDGVVEESEGPDYWWSWAVLPDGHVVALSSRNEVGGTAWWLHRFTADGGVDPGFGQAGSVRLGVSMLDAVSELPPVRDGGLFVLGSVDPAHPAGSAAAVRRILPGGRLDSRFGAACSRSGPRAGTLGGAATSDGGIFATARGFVRHARIDSFVLRYGSDGCVSGRTLRVRGVSAGPPLLRGRHMAMVGATYERGLALIRIRR